MTIDKINGIDRAAFVAVLGSIFEHSPWVAERAWAGRPFADVSALREAMALEVKRANRDEQLALICAHPDLGSRARMSDASVGEQAGAGLDRLTEDEYALLRSLNTAYREKFGFPFIFAVRGSTKHDVLAALGARLEADPEAEFEEALAQIFRIAEWRLMSVIDE